VSNDRFEGEALLKWFLLIIDGWRAFASPLHHPYFSRASASGGGSKRDGVYVLSLAMSLIVFVGVTHTETIRYRAFLGAMCCYRSCDILVSLLRIGVTGNYGLKSGTALRRPKIMRNTLAVLINYVELVFWFGAIYLMHGMRYPTEYSVPMNASLAFVLSFTTATTIGYGNIAPQGFFSAAICYIQALTCIVLLSFVIGNLIGLTIATQSEEKSNDSTNDNAAASRDPLNLPSSTRTWLIQRTVVALTFYAIVYFVLRP
jgi:hypothetical protein